jgi:hypothetical protein
MPPHDPKPHEKYSTKLTPLQEPVTQPCKSDMSLER